MARLWSSGAELQTSTAGIEFTAITTAAPAVETSTKRSGNAAWRINNTSAVEGFRQNHSAAPNGAFYFRFYVYVVALPTNTRVIGGARLTGGLKISIRLTSGGLLQLFNSEDNAQIGSDSSAISTATWYRIELFYDTTTLASTSVEARAYADTPGATAFWNPSGTIDLAATPSNFGCYTDAGDSTLDYIVDDLAINDTSGSFQNSWCGEGEIIILRPNGNGDNSGWTGSDGNSTDNYLLLDEVPPNTTDYVQSNTSGQIDDYDLEATPAALGSTDIINVVHVGVYAAVDNAASADPNIKLRIKSSSGGTVEESASLDCNSVTYQGPAPLPANSNYQLTLYNLPGASTDPYTKAALDTTQVGISEDVSDTDFARVSAIWVLVDHKPASGTEYTQSASGGITPSGAVNKSAGKILAGGNTPAGVVNKSSAKAFSGSMTPSGALVKQIEKLLAGAISSIVGTLTTAIIYGKTLAGSITPDGTLTKQARKTLSGDVTSSGNITKSIGKSLSGSVSSIVGTLNKQINKVLLGAITSIVGTLEAAKTALISLGGSITPSGSISKRAQKNFSGDVTPSGNIIKQSNKSFSGNVIPTGSIIKSVLKFLSGVLTFVGDLVADFIPPGGQTFFKDLSGSISPSGAIQKLTSKLFSGSNTPSGTLLKLTSKSFSGTLTSSGSILTAVIFVKILEGALTLQGSLQKMSGKSLAGNVTPSGILNRMVAKFFSGIINSSGVLTAISIFIKVLEGTLVSTGVLQKRADKNLGSEMQPSGSLLKLSMKSLQGTLPSVGTLFKGMFVTLSGTLASSGTVGRILNAIQAVASKVYLRGSRILAVALSGSRTRIERLSGTYHRVIRLLGNNKTN